MIVNLKRRIQSTLVSGDYYQSVVWFLYASDQLTTCEPNKCTFDYLCHDSIQIFRDSLYIYFFSLAIPPYC